MYRVSTLGRFASVFMKANDRPVTDAPPPTPSALSRFSTDERGNVAMTFGLMLMVMTTFVFASIDMGRWMQARRMTQEAIDAAVLGGMKKYQESSDTAAAVVAAKANYDYNVSSRATLLTDTITFEMQAGNTQMKAVGNATMAMPFLQMINFPSLPLLKSHTNAELDEHAIAKSAVGANTGTNLEISVMIDITGSMGESDGAGSTKIQTVKLAAKSLVDIVVWDNQSTVTSKVAIIPFSQGVNLGTTARTDAARGSLLAGASLNAGNQQLKVLTGYNNNSPTYTLYNASSVCVTERTGVHAYDDSSPTVAPVGPMYTYNGSCPTQSPLLPLTNDKVAIKALVDSLTDNGYTAGQMGTAWAWYALSPNFNGLWPAASAARPYSDMTTMNGNGQPLLKKIAILMTDGDYNTQYCKGLGNWDQNCNGDNGSSQSQAQQLCTSMKSQGITVYTIGAQVSNSAKTFLQGCASTPQHYYDATDGNKLQQAFRDIATKLVPPYLIH
jgi:Flp pilus assembly protein TadG